MDLTKVVTAEEVARGAVKFEGLVVDGDDVYWVESRPEEGGRSVLVRQRPGGVPKEVLPRRFSVRSRAHEYGGGAFAVRKGVVVFSNDKDGRLYVARPRSKPRPITPKDGGRFGDLSFDWRRGRIVAIRERERDEVVSVSLDGGRLLTLVSGDDFYASPRVSHDAKTIAWLSWSHPNMPWDKNELWTAELREYGLRQLLGPVPPNGSHADPAWARDGALWFSVDPHGWWRLYCLKGNDYHRPIVNDDAEYAAPLWRFGAPRFVLLSSRRAVAIRRVAGQDQIGVVNLRTRSFQRLPIAVTEVQFLASDPNNGTVAYIAGGPATPTSVYRLKLGKRPACVQIRADDQLRPQLADPSIPEPVSFQSEDGRTAHAFYYAPAGVRPLTPPSTLPPLIVATHGGPTGAASTALNLEIQYWTSRGFAVLDVNYGGSYGYGRAYRERLRGMWGIVDVADCVAGVQDMVRRGYADPSKVVIRGKSAGGYTTLACLAFTSSVFKAGTAYYGIGNLETLAGEGTDRFESRYLDGLVPPSERRARSPLFHADRMNCPVMFFHGELDKAVPPEQSKAMHGALQSKGIYSDYKGYENEGHGFRHAENIADALEREYAFYRKVLGL